MLKLINPYTGKTLGQFFTILCERCFHGAHGPLAPDEVQLLVLALLAFSGALVGTFLVLRRVTMLANSLSHTILLGIVGAYLLLRTGGVQGDILETLSTPVLMGAALITGVLTTLCTEFLTRVLRVQTDASTGLVFTLFFAASIVLVSVCTHNTHVSTELVMGNVDALTAADLKSVSVVAAVNGVVFSALFVGFTLCAFDGQYARLLGFSPALFNYILMIQTAATAIAAFRAVGVLMILAFFVFPVLTARLFWVRLLPIIGGAIGVGVAVSVLGVALSRHFLTVYGWGLSTGGLVVVLLGLSFGASWGAVSLRSFWLRRLAQQHTHVKADVISDDADTLTN